MKDTVTAEHFGEEDFHRLVEAGVFSQLHFKEVKRPMRWPWLELFQKSIVRVGILEVGSGPLLDSDRVGNQLILDQRPREFGFRFEVDQDQAHGADGWCVQCPPEHRVMQEEIGAFPFTSIPVEIGYCDEGRVIRRMLRYGGNVCRWPYQSEVMYMLMGNISVLHPGNYAPVTDDSSLPREEPPPAGVAAEKFSATELEERAELKRLLRLLEKYPDLRAELSS